MLESDWVNGWVGSIHQFGTGVGDVGVRNIGENKTNDLGSS